MDMIYQLFNEFLKKIVMYMRSDRILYRMT
jgi:hypothetical protein